MKTEEEFLTYYKAAVAPEFVRSDKTKKSRNALPLIMGAYFILVIIAIFFIGDFAFFFAFFGIAVGSMLWRLNWKRIGNNSTPSEIKLKEKLINEMLHFYAPGLTYKPEEGMLDKTIDISNLFDGFNYFTSDSIEGKWNNTYIQMCSLCTAEPNKTDQYIFAGIYLMATFNKNFHGQYVVFSGFEVAPSVYVPGIEGPVKLTRINLENPEFNDKFSVFGTDHELEVRYIFTPLMMQKMLDVANNYEEKIHFAFARNRMFFAISTDTPPFQDEINSMKDAEVLQRWNRIIHFSLSMVEQFHLDEHLWSRK